MTVLYKQMSWKKPDLHCESGG